MKKTIDKKEKPITVSLKVAGYDRLVDVDSILDFFRSLDVDPLKIKSRATFDVKYGNNNYRKIMNITQFRRLLGNDLCRKLNAKIFNSSLGIIANYE